jgi:hypothetical protein
LLGEVTLREAGSPDTTLVGITLLDDRVSTAVGEALRDVISIATPNTGLASEAS